jgi:hypothetical protein
MPMKNEQAPQPTLLNITLAEVFAAFAAAGMLSAQIDPPDEDDIAERAVRLGRKMAARSRRGRK